MQVHATPARASMPARQQDTLPVRDTSSIRPADSIPSRSAMRDTIKGVDTLRYPLQDRRGDKLSWRNRSSFDLQDPANIRDSIIYDPKTREYYIIEKIGRNNYRKPVSMDFDEFVRVQNRRMEESYFRDRAGTGSLLNRRLQKPKLTMGNDLFNRLFGTGKVDIRPQGEVNLTAGYQGQNVKNPTLPERARKNGGLDFDMAANLNVVGSVGDKLRMPISYNTQSTFDFENQLKLDYTGSGEEIFRKIEVGNTSFATKGTLIPGAQQLFGIKTQMQFGKFWVTTIFANQRSQRQSVSLQGGSNTQPFQVKADEYEENRHFLLGQYFRDTYNTSMRNLPIINSQVQLLRIEVWVTNRTGATTNTRDVVGLMDLAESRPFQQPPVINPIPGDVYPSNGSNDLYQKIISNANSRNPALIGNYLNSLGLLPVQDYEKTFARKLDTTQYFFNRQLGFVSLNVTLQPDEVLAVAYQYTVNGRVYQVGEFSQDVPVDSTSGVQKVLFLKLLKATSQRTALPLWDLMMKNVYSVGFGQLERQDFQFNILYEEPGGGEKRYIPEGDQAGVPLITLLNLDRLNNQNDPQPDGVFDYVEGYTVYSAQSRIIFPVLEPFGKDLEYIFTTDPSLREKYLYYPLYDTIRAIAQTYANLNRFIMRGTSRSGGNSGDISLNAFNIPQGSVTVTAGGTVLQENVDYVIDYIAGTLRIINQAIRASGVPINVQFENNATFGIQQRTYLGLRWDYLVNKKLNVGGTIVRLSERPFFTKMEYGSDPIRNTLAGVDVNYNNTLPRLNKWLGYLPNYKPQGMSSISAFAEAAHMIPGHAPQIGKGQDGLIYIDDFEGTKASIDLRFPLVSWTLASTPFGATDRNGNILFPEANLFDNLDYGKNRAKLAWYNIEPILQERSNPNNPIRGNLTELSDPRVRSVSQQEIFPQRTPDFGLNQLVTFDLAYYPKDKGPYNYDANGINASGQFTNPRQRWGGIMRGIDQTDFETANIEYIEFWILDPFIKNTNPAGGSLYFNLGNISEDVLKDSRRFYENGLATPTIPAATTTSTWGVSPLNPIQVTQAFSNDPADRPFQDVGFDGISDTAELRLRADYLRDIETSFGAGSQAFLSALADPSSDNFRYYRDEFYDQQNTGILGRYKQFNSPQGNSPVATAGSDFASAFTLYPDNEDLNRDNTLNESEEYFQYRVDIKPATDPVMQVGQNFITDKKTVNVQLADGSRQDQIWYQFRIPVALYDRKVGEIPDFKSIRFMRMFLTDFEDSVVVRFAKLELVRNNWRRFTFDFDTSGQYKPIDLNGATTFNVTAVNIEENDKREPIPYRIPPGIERVQALSNGGINILQNEQALSMAIGNLQEGEARGVFKTLSLDLRQYAKLSMFVHAESQVGQPALRDGELYAVIRIGNDFINNFYEIKYPLQLTPFGSGDPEIVWPDINSLAVELADLVLLKVRRNVSNASTSQIYRETIDGKIYSLIGNPNMGEVRGILVGVENAQDASGGRPVYTEVWINELRLSGINEQGGWAAVGQVNIQLADLGTLSMSGNIHTIGFGQLEQRVNERYRDDFSQFDLSANLQLGKLLPRKANIEIPFFANYSQIISTPQFDPYDKDVILKDKIRAFGGDRGDSIQSQAIDFTNIKTINFTNVRKLPSPNQRIRLWSISNFDLSYSYTATRQQNPLIENNEVKKHFGGIGYNYVGQPKYWEPFKKGLKSKSKMLDFVRSFNVNTRPNLLGARWDTRRQFGAIRPRNVGGGPYKIPETYDKYWVQDRIYNLRWDLTKSFNVDFKAMNNSRVDEPAGRIDTKEEKDTVRQNFFKGGRNTLYNQSADFVYNFPTVLFPFLDWTTINLAYRTTYSWIGASRLAINLGNTIQNGQQKGMTMELNFAQLYTKSRMLRKLNEPAMQEPPPPPPPQPGDSAKGKPRKEPKEVQLSGAARTILTILTAIKRVGINYNEGATTFVPGYTDSTKFLGNNFRSMAPGLDFVFGKQVDSNWLTNAASRGLITSDPILNNLFRQTYDQKLTITAQLEPVRELIIDLNLDKSLSKTYTTLFKDTTGQGSFASLNPYSGGGFSISYISFQTLFRKFDPNNISETFRRFEDNRIILSERLGKLNGYSPGVGSDGYYIGYGRYAQDVLVPSFIAAYTNKDPNSVPLLKTGSGNYVRSNPFSGYVPRPNWRLTYTGLSRLKALEKVFTNFTITHAYNSTLSMNSFNSALLFQDQLGIGFPSFIDTISGNFIPYFLVPNITIREEFSPLAGFDFATTGQFSGRLEYRKSRTLSLSLIDYQLSEVRSTETTVSLRWRKRGFKLPFKVKLGKKEPSKQVDNDLTFTLDFSIRDDINSNSRLDQSNAFATGGQKVIAIRPTIDYVLSNRVNIQLYFDQRRVNPYVSSSAPVVNTRAGMQVRISLAQ
jgi:cell surface protein SprA